MSNLWRFIDVLRKGSAVADPALLKNRAGLTMALTALLWSLTSAAKGLGYELPITQDDAATLAGSIALVVGLYVNYASSSKVGILPAKPLPADLPALDPHIVDRPDVAGVNRVDRHAIDYPRDTGG